ncbi:MAG: hypothetical protein E7050_05310 [Lentisphaerae bacterium]|nr:hypothetical protein [Lentisphaerota bacterium]
MKSFINITRLDYIKKKDIILCNELKMLQHLYGIYNSKAVEFIIKNNLLRHEAEKEKLSFVAVRIVFKDIWEWHIPEELQKIIAETGKNLLSGKSGPMDCLWILKSTSDKKIPVFFCDIIFFLPDSADKNLPDVDNKISSKENCIADSRILFSRKNQENYTKDLEKLFHPSQNSTVLQCEFAHDMIV